MTRSEFRFFAAVLLLGLSRADFEAKHDEKIADLIHVPFEDFLRAKIEAKEAFFGEG